MTLEKKATLRNFTFTQSADTELLMQVQETGKTMTAVLEDLLLGRRQFAPEIERFITAETERRDKSRKAVIEAALAAYMVGSRRPSSVRTVEAEEEAILRRRAKASPSRRR